jgi:hypothetical protein
MSFQGAVIKNLSADLVAAAMRVGDAVTVCVARNRNTEY